MNRLFVPVLTLLAAISLTACGLLPEPFQGSSSAPPDSSASATAAPVQDSDVRLIQFEAPAAGSPTAVINTSAGAIEVALYPGEAPRAVENFITHAKAGYFNGMEISRAVERYLIQTGTPADKAPESVFKDADGRPVPFENEFSPNLWCFRGALVMVNEGAGNTSEFMIVAADSVDAETLANMREGGYPEKVAAKYGEIGGIPGCDGRNTVFGMAISGMDTVDAIAAVKTDDARRPLEKIIIESVTIKE